MKEKPILYIKIIVNLFLNILGIVLLFWLGPKVLSFFLPFLIALIVSAIANPLVNFLEKKVKILRKHSSAIIIVLVLAAIFALIYLCVYGVVRAISALYGEMDGIINSILNFFDEFRIAFTNLSIQLPEQVTNAITTLDANIESVLTGYAKRIMENVSLATASSYLSNVLNILILIILSVLATYFVMIDRNKISLTLSRIIPTSIQDTYRMIKSNIKTAVGGYIKTQCKLMLVIFLALLLGFQLLKVEYAILLAALTAILDFLPVLGTGIIIWPWVILKIISGEYLYALFLILISLACLLLKQLLQPKIMGDSVGLSPLYALFCMFVGYRFDGIWGMIIGIPIGMLVLSFYRAGFFDRLIKGFKIIVHDINEFRKY